MSVLHALSPRAVAILGASDNPIKAGGRPIDYMRRHGYAGRIFPINPNRSEVQGLPAYASLRALPEAPDAVVISLPSEDVAAAIDDCVAVGAKAAVIYSSGFAELGDAGRAQQADLLARARRGGLRLFGPNCQGVANFASGAILNFSTMINESPPGDGPVAIVSQSGAGAAILYGGLRRAGIGVRYMVSTGNEADICAAEAVRAVVQDERIRLVVLYVETLRQSAYLAEAARLARERGVTILAVKAGRTSAGQATASSHTGALAAEDALADAFLRQHGIPRLADFRELIDYAPLFLSQPAARGPRVVSISNSGATCVLAADAAEEFGLAVEQFDAATLAGLQQALPSYVTARNPIDMTTALLGKPETFGNTLRALSGSGAADLVHVGFPIGGEGYDFADFAAQASRFAQDSGMPIAVSVNQDWVAQAFQAQGVPTFWSERAAAARDGSPNSHEPYFFAVGRFIPKKDFPGLIRAFAAFRRDSQQAHWRLVLGGDGPERARIEAEIAAVGLQDAVVLPQQCLTRHFIDLAEQIVGVGDGALQIRRTDDRVLVHGQLPLFMRLKLGMKALGQPLQPG